MITANSSDFCSADLGLQGIGLGERLVCISRGSQLYFILIHLLLYSW